MGLWETLLAALGGTSILLILLGWLFRSLGKHLLDKDLESFKTSLSTAANSSVEELKHRLQIAQLEHQVRFSNLHQRRAEVIAEMYELLTDFYATSERFASVTSFSGEPSRDEKYRKALEDGSKFYIYFDHNRIWLPVSLCAVIDKLAKEIRSTLDSVGIYLPFAKDNMPVPPHVANQHHEAWGKAAELFRSEYPRAREGLEAELRQLLGDLPSQPDHSTPH